MSSSRSELEYPLESLQQFIRTQAETLYMYLMSRENGQEASVVRIPSIEMRVVILGSDTSMEDLLAKDGRLPASKTAIKAIPIVKITEDEGGEECPICLTGYDVGGESKEMSCKHRFHSGCIEKWLGIHGSCPVCRYQMPVDEEEENDNTRRIDEEDRGRLVGGGGVLVIIDSRHHRDGRDFNGASASESSDNDGSLTQDIEFESNN